MRWLLASALVAVVLGTLVYFSRSDRSRVSPRVLASVSVGLALVAVALSAADTVQDRGAAGLVLIAVPVAIAVLAVVSGGGGIVRSGALWALAAVQTSWALVAGLRIGLAFLPAAVALTMAALAASTRRATAFDLDVT